jgi:hypothetical protein
MITVWHFRTTDMIRTDVKNAAVAWFRLEITQEERTKINCGTMVSDRQTYSSALIN